MAKRHSKKSIKKKKNSIQTNIEVGGNIGGNFVVGDHNIINLATQEQIRLRSLHQLTQPPADFTGRETLIDQLLRDFDSHKGATISGLTGMGGIGKTALGLVVAHQIAEKYPDAQIFLDLKGTTEPLSAVDIARHVILSFEPTADLRTLDDANLFSAYQSVLHGKKVLLFFDNARSAEQIAQLRPPDSCTMLVTSRWTFSVPGLQSRRVDAMREDDAKKFLLELCPPIKDTAADLAKACVYLPLALRIAGSFLQVNDNWSVEKYLDQFTDRKKRLDILKQSREDAELTTEPDLLVTFELSYNQLSEKEKKEWRILSVFPTSFDALAAQSMLGLEGNESRKLLGLLRRYSLLEFDENSSRYSLHDLLADYGLSKMEDREQQDARLRHASHYLRVMHIADNLYGEGGEQILKGLRLFDLEWEHIRLGKTWAAENHARSNDIARLCSNYTANSYLVDLRLHPRDRLSWHEASLLADRFLGDRSSEGVDIGNLGNAHAELGEARKAVELYEQALVIAREFEDRRNEGTWLGNLGVAYAQLGEPRKAIEFHEQALIITREIGDRQGEGRNLGNLGIAYKNLGEAPKAIEFYEQTLVITREMGDRRGEGKALMNLGSVYLILGQERKAIEFYERALIIAREIGDRENQGSTLFNMGLALYDVEEKMVLP